MTGAIANTDRAFGAGIAGAIAARFGDRGLPDGSVQLAMTGSAGQSFGAFALPGMRLSLIGDANDGLGKGMHGGEIVVAPAARERGRANQVLAGNAALYGATGGRLFLAGLAGERFAHSQQRRDRGGRGVGDHACEYMTGGTVVVLGAVGQNFAAGMTGGVIYVAGSRESLAARTNPQQLSIDAPTAAEQKLLRELLETHERLTGSRIARSLLRFDRHLAGFCRITPAVARPWRRRSRPRPSRSRRRSDSRPGRIVRIFAVIAHPLRVRRLIAQLPSVRYLLVGMTLPPGRK